MDPGRSVVEIESYRRSQNIVPPDNPGPNTTALRISTDQHGANTDLTLEPSHVAKYQHGATTDSPGPPQTQHGVNTDDTVPPRIANYRPGSTRCHYGPSRS